MAPRVDAEYDGLVTGQQFTNAKARDMDTTAYINFARRQQGIPEIDWYGF